MVIDAGGSYGGFDAGERIVAPYLWSQKIMRVDYLALSHPDLDHFGGLDFIAMNFAPRAFWTTGVVSSDVSYARFMDDLAQRQNSDSTNTGDRADRVDRWRRDCFTERQIRSRADT